MLDHEYHVTHQAVESASFYSPTNSHIDNLDLSDWITLGIGAGLGFFASLSATRLHEKSKRPRLLICSGIKNDDAKPLRFYHLVVKNIGKSTAYDCEIDISFRNNKGEQLLAEKIIRGKWDKGPNPLIQCDPATVPVFQPSFLHYSEYANLRPSKDEPFCLIIKHEGEKECYGFSAENYRYVGLKHPNRKIIDSEFLAVITVGNGDNTRTCKFRIVNSTTDVGEVTIKQECDGCENDCIRADYADCNG